MQRMNDTFGNPWVEYKPGIFAREAAVLDVYQERMRRVESSRYMLGLDMQKVLKAGEQSDVIVRELAGDTDETGERQQWFTEQASIATASNTLLEEAAVLATDIDRIVASRPAEAR